MSDGSTPAVIEPHDDGLLRVRPPVTVLDPHSTAPFPLPRPHEAP